MWLGNRSRPAPSPPPPASHIFPLLAVIEGRPYSVLPLPEVERSEEAEQAYRRCMQDADRVAARLEQDDPGSAARFQAEVERKRTTNLRAIEREAKAREAA